MVAQKEYGEEKISWPKCGSIPDSPAHSFRH